MSTHHEKIIQKKLNSFNMYSTFTLTDEYCSFDLENNDFIIEVKWRTQHYDDQIFEEIKLHKNLQTGLATNRDFIYLVRTTKGVYCWPITKMVRSGHRFEWYQKMLPATSEFSNREWVSKSVSNLLYSDATEFKLGD